MSAEGPSFRSGGGRRTLRDFALPTLCALRISEMKKTRRDGVGRAFDSGFENAYFGEITISI